MTTPPRVLVLLFVLPLSGQAQELRDPLLERLIGTWVPKGTIAGEPATHDVAAE